MEFKDELGDFVIIDCFIVDKWVMVVSVCCCFFLIVYGGFDEFDCNFV